MAWVQIDIFKKDDALKWWERDDSQEWHRSLQQTRELSDHHRSHGRSQFPDLHPDAPPAARSLVRTWLGHIQRMLNIQMISILSSFLMIIRSYFRIKNLTKKGAFTLRTESSCFSPRWCLLDQESSSQELSSGSFFLWLTENFQHVF